MESLYGEILDKEEKKARKLLFSANNTTGKKN